jgi:hypothetical protein
MAATGFTPISLYYSATASAVPLAANLTAGELALNTADGKLYYKNSSNVVTLLAGSTSGPAGGSTTQVQYNSSGVLAGSANFIFDGTNLGVGGTPSGTYRLEVTGKSYSSGGIVTRTVAYADGASLTFNVDTTDTATQANTQATGTLTINAPTGTPYNGQKLIFRLQSTNVQTFAWNAIFIGSLDLTLPTASTGSSKYDYMGFQYNSTSAKWNLLARTFGF